MEKLKISRAIIVEGKYDKIKLSSIVDGVIIVTNGFRIYKDPDKAALIRYYAQHGGIAILTDSDTAGFRIRGHIKGIVPKGDIVNVYVPEIFGKEKRKTEPSKEGLLGVEGVPADIIREAFEKAGIIGEFFISIINGYSSSVVSRFLLFMVTEPFSIVTTQPSVVIL